MGSEDSILEVVQKQIKDELAINYDAEKERIEIEITELQEKALATRKDKAAGRISTQTYNERIQYYTEQVHTLEEKEATSEQRSSKLASINVWMENYRTCVANGDIFKPDKANVMRQMVEKMVVFKDFIEIYFKCGIRIKQEYVK